ncbi:HPP family protein [Haloarculaceae archaeon H-GB11]|nr:HPP family protein [Haloarculaceae archaeon H-GB1-1]MEA5385973.1 HPP family protein [Haloarculaceae archaeon H-GB11]
MDDRLGLYDFLYAWARRARRIERRELREFRRWLEQTRNLVHLSALLFVPLLIGVVTLLSNSVQQLSFLLFPPLASGTYTLFANPDSRYATPSRFVAGLTIGALCGWLAVILSSLLLGGTATGQFQVHAGGAALAVFLTGAVTWPLDVEEPSAFSTALLTLLVPSGVLSGYVASVFLASSLVAGVFSVWHDRVYEQRAAFLYESTKGDDHVLVPMRGANPDATAMLAARLAGAHDAGKVVLLDLVESADAAMAERELLDDHRRPAPLRADGGRTTDGRSSDEALSEVEAERAVSSAVTNLEMRAAEIETQVGVPCEVVVAVDGANPAPTVLQIADEVNCDLVAASYEERHGGLSPFVRDLFRGDTDVVVHRSHAGRTRWRRVLVPVRRASDVAHSMLDFACRLAGEAGRISAATCLPSDKNRRQAEEMLADLVDPFGGTIETRVSVGSIESFLAETTGAYDLVIMGASTDRSAASRLISPPTFERIQDLDTDVAIVDRS